MVKMHSQQPKTDQYNVLTKVERDLQTHGRILSLKWLFWSNMVISSHMAAVSM